MNPSTLLLLEGYLECQRAADLCAAQAVRAAQEARAAERGAALALDSYQMALAFDQSRQALVRDRRKTPVSGPGQPTSRAARLERLMSTLDLARRLSEFAIELTRGAADEHRQLVAEAAGPACAKIIRLRPRGAPAEGEEDLPLPPPPSSA